MFPSRSTHRPGSHLGYMMLDLPRKEECRLRDVPVEQTFISSYYYYSSDGCIPAISALSSQSLAFLASKLITTRLDVRKERYDTKIENGIEHDGNPDENENVVLFGKGC